MTLLSVMIDKVMDTSPQRGFGGKKEQHPGGSNFHVTPFLFFLLHSESIFLRSYFLHPVQNSR